MNMLDTSFHKRKIDAQMQDEEFRGEFERAKRELAQIDQVIQMLDALREEAGLSKAGLARLIGKNAASIRRLFTAEVNPELRTVAAMAEALNAEIHVVPRAKRKRAVGKKQVTSVPA